MVKQLTALFYSYSAAIQNNRKNGNVTYHMQGNRNQGEREHRPPCIFTEGALLLLKL